MRYIFLLLYLLSFYAYSGPICDWKPIKVDNTQSNNYTVQIITYWCSNDFYKDMAYPEYITAQEAVILDNDNNIVENHIGSFISITSGILFYSDEVRIVDTPKDFPYLTLQVSSYGNGGPNHTYILYSTTPTLKKIDTIHGLLYTKGERIVNGFYKNENVFLIDRWTTEGTEAGTCRACQSYNIETFKVTSNGLVSLGLTRINNKRLFKNEAKPFTNPR